MMWQVTLPLSLLVAAACGATPLSPSCLPLKTTVVSVNVRALGSHYCSNSTQDQQLISQLLAEVERGPVDNRCQLTAPQLSECIPVGQGQANMRTRMIITATMTCDSPCVRHNSTLQTLSVLQDNLLYLRTAAQQRVSVNLNIGGVNILMWFFDGRRSIVSTCEGGSTTSVIKGLSLCDCPAQCDKCGGGLYLPPMSSQCQSCPQGTWRQMGMDYTSCVQCPPNTDTLSFGASAPTDCVTPACPQGMVYLSCGPVCPATCTNPTPPEGCPTNCMTGCFCPPNTVQYYGECIMLSNCTSLTPAPPRPPTIVDTNITSGNIPLTIGYDIRVYEGVNITIDCSPLVVAHPNGSIHWRTQLINPRQVIRDELEVPISATSIELVVPSTSIPNFLQESFRCVVCTSQTECWSNNSIISVVTIPPPPPSPQPPPTLPPVSCPPGMVYDECGSACPPSCAGSSDFCPSVCVAGCYCPNGSVEDGGQCVNPEDCSQPSIPTPSNLALLSCPPGMVYHECGSACPPSCSNNTDTYCPSVCVAGCYCPDGMVEDGDQCVNPENCSQPNTLIQPPFCQLPQDPGPCNGMVLMYAYNSMTQECDQFYYGGCPGNDNVFSTEQECLDVCST